MKALLTFARGKCFNSNFGNNPPLYEYLHTKNQFSSSNREPREVRHDAESNYANGIKDIL